MAKLTVYLVLLLAAHLASAFDDGPRPKLRIMNKNMAPLEKNLFRVVLELTGAAPGVDIVAVLDVSGSMKEERLEKLKTAMRILIMKLQPTDQLSVVTFFHKPTRSAKKTEFQMIPLKRMTAAGKKEIERTVNSLQHIDGAAPSTIAVCLEKALQMLNARNDSTSQRVPAIMLMSDGDPRRDNGDAAQVPFGNVPLYKFSFAHEYGYDGLQDIGNSDKGGTFPLTDIDVDFDVMFSQCLLELSQVVVQDLKLTFTPCIENIYDVEMTPMIKQVFAGNCPQSRDDTTGSISIMIDGELYSGEIRRIMVDLLLPAVSTRLKTNVLRITQSYTMEGQTVDGYPLHIHLIRRGKLLEEVKEETDLLKGGNNKEEGQMTLSGATTGKGFIPIIVTCVVTFLGVLAYHLANLYGKTGQTTLLVGVLKPFRRFFPKLKGRYYSGFVISILTCVLVSALKIAQQQLSTIIMGCCIVVPICIYIFPFWTGAESPKLNTISNALRSLSIWNPSSGTAKENSSVFSEDQVQKIVEELPALDSLVHLVQNIPEELPAMDSVARLKSQILAEIQNSKSIQVGLNDRQRLLKGEAEGNIVIKKIQETLYGRGIPFGVMKNKGKATITSEDQVKDSVARLKGQILTAIQQYNSAKESLRTIQHSA